MLVPTSGVSAISKLEGMVYADAVTSKIIIQTTQFVAVREGRWGIGVIEILVDCMTSSWSYERGSRVRFEGFVGSQLLLCVPLLRLMGLS